MPNVRKIITSPDDIRNSIHQKVKSAIKQKFPVEVDNYRAELDNISIKKVEMPHARQRNVLLAKGNATDGVYVDISIVDTKTGKKVSELKNHRMVNIPFFTNRYTMIIDGNEYAISNQMRTKSGIYTRKRGNDDLESSFNLSKGANFQLVMAPDSGMFKVNILGSTLPMYAVLKILGAPDNEIRSTLGQELYATNSGISKAQHQRTRDTLYKKLASYKDKGLGESASSAEKEQKIREYFSNTELNSETTKITLGTAYTKVNYQSILSAATKILKVFNEEEDYDERDNLEFQQIYSVEDILQEVLDKNRDAIGKIKSKLRSFDPQTEGKEKLKSVFSPVYFSKPIRNFITTSSIARLPSQINPAEMMDTAATVTRLGEGAISSEQAVPDETRAVNYSYMGVIDPVATPESSKIGIDNRLTVSAMKGDDNEFYREVLNNKTGEVEQHRVIDLHDKTLGFPDPSHSKGKTKDTDKVPAIKQGKITKVNRSDLDYQIPSPHDLNTVTTSTIPFANANDGVRGVMGAKHVQQALPLKDPDVRHVSTDTGSKDVLNTLSGFLIPKSPVDGVVSKISDEYIHIKDKSGSVHKVDYENNLPLATKTFLDNDLIVSQGDKVTKGQPLAGNNFTRDGKLAMGKNLNVAYMPYEGLNHEDGIVVSESATNKFTSVHSEKVTVRLDKLKKMGKQEYTSHFPTTFTREQLNKLDSDGIAKKGAVLEQGDPIIVLLEDSADSRRNQILGQLHKSLITPYTDASEVYEGDSPAEVLEVSKSGSWITVLLRTEKKAKVGDKLSGSHGNKGVISKVIPDDQMPQNEDGKPVDAIFTPIGVPGRMNPGQILEGALGKVSEKTGKKYQVENYGHEDYVDFVKNELKKNNVKDKETVTDPKTGKKIDDVFVGNAHVYKLFKTTESNFAARGIEGPYDQDETPTGSGESGPKATGGMEVNALLGHNARNFLRESSSLRSSKNTEFWKSFQQGKVAHFPKEKNTFNKFVNTLKQAGVKVDKEGDEFVAGPMTDNDILEMSSGEIQSAERLLAKDLSPEKGGLFDENKTGGMQGTKWSHVKLTEPVINPVFEDTVRTLMDETSQGLTNKFIEQGGNELKKEMNSIDVDSKLDELSKKLDDDKLKGVELDKTVKKYKYLKALKKQDLKPGDAYMLENVPVTPPIIRPITVGKTGDIMENDANYLYRDLILQNNTFKNIKKADLGEEDIKENRKALAQRVKEVSGFVAPSSPQLQGKNVKGAAAFIAGKSPKEGYFQNKVIYSKMNTSGSGTITPDTTLGLDEIGMPEDAAWSMYKPFLIRKFSQMGYPMLKAREEIENRSDMAREILLEELEERPAVVNRAPTLWRHSMLAAKPQLRPGKSLQINTLWENSLNSDFDGDSCIGSVMTRVSNEKTLHENCFLGLISAENDTLSTLTYDEGESRMPFSESSKVRFNYGLINLQDFPRLEETKKIVDNVVRYKVPEDIEILTVMNGERTWCPVEEFSIHKNVKIYEVETTSGRSLHPTEDHSLISVDKDLNYLPVKPQTGLTIPRVVQPITGAYYGSIKVLNDSVRGFGKEITFALDYNLGWISGLFASDGWINDTYFGREIDHPNDVMMSKDDKPLQDKWIDIIDTYFPGQISRCLGSHHQFNGTEAYSEKITLTNNILKNYFKYNFGHGAANKSLPCFWMQAPEEFRWGLLAGLIDGDGSVSTTKAKAKKRSQVCISYTSISKTLIFEIVALANSLGLTATAGFSKITEAGNECWYVVFNTASIMAIQRNVILNHSDKAERLNKVQFHDNTLKSIDGRVYTPRLSTERLREIQKYVGNTQIYKTRNEGKKRITTDELRVPEDKVDFYKQKNSLYNVIHKTIKTGSVLTKQSAKALINLDLEIFKTSDFWKKWKEIVLDDTIEWDIITSLKPVPEITEAYDLTVPPNYTMVTEAGYVVQDTMFMHIPVTDEAVKDAKNMYPSKQLFSDKNKNDLLMAPTNEPIIGLYKATKNAGKPYTGQQVHKFNSAEEAWQAYYDGKLKMTDYVEIN